MSKKLILGITLSLLFVSNSFFAYGQRGTLAPIAVRLRNVPFSAPTAPQAMLTRIR